MRLSVITLVALAACQRTETVTRNVNLHLAAQCPMPPLLSSQYTATGDYSPAGMSSLMSTNMVESIDGIPSNPQSLGLQGSANGAQWWGLSLVPSSGDVDMLVLPQAQSCELATNVGFTQGMVFGVASSQSLVVLQSAGGGTPGVRVDLTTGQIDRMTVGLKQPRTNAALTMLGTTGTQAIVTGGLSNNELVNLALGGEIYDDSIGDFEPTPVGLTTSRADHAAVTLASGDVILVGGYGQAGTPLAQTERISFSQGQWVSAASTPALATARTKPVAIRLADGTVLVGGGFDASGAPVGSIELYSPDFSRLTGSIPPFAVRSKHAFVALDGGGALLVTAPDPTDNPNDFQRSYFIPPNGPAAVPIANDVTVTMTDVKLVPTAGGRALLWTGSAWLSYDPWAGGFSQVVVAAPAPATSVVAPDPGIRAWVEGNGLLDVWRDSARNGFATDGPYLVTDTSNMAPDTAPAPTFAATTGLSLGAGETAWVADARYLDVDVDVQTPQGMTLPDVVLRVGDGTEVEVGAGSCAVTLAGSTRLHVERQGGVVSYAVSGFPSPCATLPANARVAVGVRGGNSGSNALQLTVTRLGAPQP